MKRLFAATTLLIAVIGVLVISEGASAKNAILDDFTAAYPVTAGTALANCSTCHTSAPALNPYGSAVRAAGLNFASVESRDSDGDGFTNLEEIRALTNPGDASDHPVTTTTSTTTTSPTSTTSATSTTSTTIPVVVSGATIETTVPSGAAAFDAGLAGTVWLIVEDGRLVVTDVVTTRTR